jgi:antirestriction protein ArdC
MAHTDKLAEVHDRLIAAIDDLVSGDDWRRFLEASQRLHAYSPNNVLLILAQRPTASRAAGYRTWQSLGYQVRRGEKGIAVLAPIVSRRRPVDIEDELEHPEVVRILRGFRVVHVFDIEQCDGPPWPDVRPALLTGDAPAALWDLLAAQVDAAGFSIERGACTGANGRTDFDAHSVRVRDDVAPAQAVKTLAHELAHVLLHDGTEYAAGCRGRAEIEAESVAFLVLTTTGVDAGSYSFPYVAAWSHGNTDRVAHTADRVITCARQIIAGLGLDSEDAVA